MKGLAVTPDGDAVVSCSTDCSVRLFRLPFAPFAPGPVQDSAGAVLEFQGRHAFRGVDHHWTSGKFATAGAQVSTLPLAQTLQGSLCGQDGGQQVCDRRRSGRHSAIGSNPTRVVVRAGWWVLLRSEVLITSRQMCCHSHVQARAVFNQGLTMRVASGLLIRVVSTVD